MKKTTLLLLALGFFALTSCKEQPTVPEGLQEKLSAKTVNTLMANGVEAETFTAPTRTYGSTTLNVQDYGATGGNTTDDTEAFQDAIDALPTTGSNVGGTIWVPAGTYYIKGDFKDVDSVLIGPSLDNPTNCIKLRSNMRLLLSPYAHLKQIATDAYASMIVYAYNVHDVTIEGQISGSDTSEFVGERGPGDIVGMEGGHGIQLRGASNVTIKNLKLNEFHGDGISISSTLSGTGQPNPKIVGRDIVIDNIHSHHNRRQGLSIGPANNVQVWDSEFSNTDGTSPKCGIDIEPEAGLYADTVLIQNNIFRGNANEGILLNSARAKNTTIKHNNIVSNLGAGIASNGDDAYIAFNLIYNNSARAISLMGSSIDNTIVQNTLYENNGNASRGATLNLVGMDPAGYVNEPEKDIFINTAATNPVVYTNTYK